MNSLLPSGNIRTLRPIRSKGLVSGVPVDVPPSDPQYEALALFLPEADEAKARKVLEEYRKKHPEADAS